MVEVSGMITWHCLLCDALIPADEMRSYQGARGNGYVCRECDQTLHSWWFRALRALVQWVMAR